MIWTDEDARRLRDFRNRIDDDNIKCKEIIKRKLIKNKGIIHVLNNRELVEADAEPDDYFGVNIRPAYIIPEVQTKTLNYVVYTCGFKDSPQWARNIIKYLQITFVVLVHQDLLIDEETSLARHDLLSALINEEFNLSLAFGDRIQLMSSIEGVTDSRYVTRTLVYETMTDKDLVKYKMDVPTLVNHSTLEV